MADPASYANPDRDIEQALKTLKKGTQLLKYSRKGKPKFRPFRLSPDETTLIWNSHGHERNLKLSSVQRIIPGQRTAVFKRYLRPEKEYLSFSLIYNNGDRSLDLICKDNAEAEVWLSCLKTLISSPGQARNKRTRSNFSDFHDIGSSDSSSIHSGRPIGSTSEATLSIPRGSLSTDSNSSLSLRSSDVGSDHANMQMRTSGDGIRISVSSSCSSGPEDIESQGDVYVWGDIWCYNNDVLIPKALESNIVLDVLQISCGVKHVALVTRQGEIFTWGEKDLSQPRAVELLAVTNVDFAACGEYHTYVVSASGEIFTWGDGHWIPKRICGVLEGLQVISIACGTWHSALATNNGKLFTFGDGTFGVLGHGDRESVAHFKEVECMSGMNIIKVACGIWHTAAIIQSGSGSGGKLFTWGDGDKNRLGHGNKNTYFVPTCVSALIDYNFHQIACGHNNTVALTTSGHVFTMGSNTYGQLGNPQVDGKLPCLVQDRLVGEFVEEISCGSFHVAVLTSRSEVFTWGRGGNGRLGHGGTEDCNIPTLVEGLKDRHVKNIACGSNFTACICMHKWVSGTDQSVCTCCKQQFGFTRKRHNCYNCGLVHCGGCSSKKAMKAALAPTPGKPYRVCDSCYIKLKKVVVESKKPTPDPRRVQESRRIDRGGGGGGGKSRLLISPTIEPVKYLEVKSTKPGGTTTDYSIVRASQVPNTLKLKDVAFPSSLSAFHYSLNPVVIKPQPSPPSSRSVSPYSRPVSPYARRASPPRSVTPIFSKGPIDNLKKKNDLLTQEVSKLKNQVNKLKQKIDVKDAELDKLNKKANEVAEKFSEAMKSITDQLKQATEKLPSEIPECETIKSMPAEFESVLKSIDSHSSLIAMQKELDSSKDQDNIHVHISQNSNINLQGSKNSGPSLSHHTNNEAFSTSSRVKRSERQKEAIEQFEPGVQESNNGGPSHSHHTDHETAPTSSRAKRSEVQKEAIEQFEPGVYVTLTELTNGTKIFKRVRFSKRRFSEQHAEEWWSKNKDRLLKKYSLPKTNITSAESSA